jgi:hypothetical protein
MALDALWLVLNRQVSRVSGVQAPIHGHLRDTPADFPEVAEGSGTVVTGRRVKVSGDLVTPDTPPGNVRYPAQPAWALGCTPDTLATPRKVNNEPHAAYELLPGARGITESTEVKLLFGHAEPRLAGAKQSAARAYHAHHFSCRICVTAGRGSRYGERFAAGLALWNDYRRD